MRCMFKWGGHMRTKSGTRLMLLRSLQLVCDLSDLLRFGFGGQLNKDRISEDKDD